MHVDWHNLLVPHASLLELFIRGTFMYFALLLLLRIVVRRHMGSLSVMDLLLLVLIADAAQNAMAGEYKSLSEGVVLCGTLIGWSYALDWLAFRFPLMRRWLEPPPLPLVRHGRMQRRHMRQELISEDELLAQLRQHGVADIKHVKIAYIEGAGQLSVFLDKTPSTTSTSLHPHRPA